ncbi:MAG: hypothetical protein II907_04710 [Firmicutes bacterium]|nr:hypothetical protein [Bacillota bacterium]MBQ6295580.1 hypothetical protein [Bacillota bacterium]
MDSKKNTNRQYKDRLFKVIFGSPEHKEYALSLYNAVNNSHYTDAELLDFYTIENVVYMGMKNDLSFIFDATLNLYEQQSSFNPNMPLRGLMYLSKQYEKYVEDHHLNVYRGTLCKVPAPRYIVFYNGNDIQPDKRELKLSDAFITSIHDAALEVTAIMLNINFGQNKKIMKTCAPLNDYSKFVSYVKMNQRKGLAVQDAVSIAVEKAIEENLLDGFFAEHRAEVIGMILTEYDEEFVHKGWFEDGVKKGQIDIIKSMLAFGMTPEKISECTKIPLETIRNIQA